VEARTTVVIDSDGIIEGEGIEDFEQVRGELIYQEKTSSSYSLIVLVFIGLVVIGAAFVGRSKSQTQKGEKKLTSVSGTSFGD